MTWISTTGDISKIIFATFIASLSCFADFPSSTRASSEVHVLNSSIGQSRSIDRVLAFIQHQICTCIMTMKGTTLNLLFCISAFALPQLIPNGLSPVCSTRLDTIRPETDVFGHKSGNLKAPEDRMVIKQFMVNGQSLSVHGIFDGHGGEMVAQWLEDHLAERVASVFEQINPQSENEAKQLLLQITLDTDKYLCTQFSKQLADQYRNEGEFDKEYAYIDGSTASFVVQWLDRAYVVQVGDSTTIVYQDNEAVFET